MASFCASCGERRLSPRDLTIRHFAIEASRQVSDLESGLLRTLRALITRPGLLTREYMSGRRRLYLSPFQLFLLCNLAFFIGEKGVGASVLSTHLTTHVSQQPYSPLARRMVDAAIRQRGETEQHYAAAFNATVDAQASTLVIAMVPLFALIFAGVEWRKRRPWLQHLVFAFHFVGVFLLLFIALGALLIAGALLGDRVLGVDASRLIEEYENTLVPWFMTGMSTLYLTLGFRCAYGDGWVGALIRGVVVSSLLIVVLFAYRLILFFTTYYAL